MVSLAYIACQILPNFIDIYTRKGRIRSSQTVGRQIRPTETKIQFVANGYVLISSLRKRRFFLTHTKMPITRKRKEEQLAELVDKFKRAKTVSFAQNKGLTVFEVKELRGKLREKNSDMKIAKKTLMKIAAKEAGYKDVPDDVLKGAVGAVFTYDDDIVAGAKTIYEYAKKHEALALLGALLDGKVLNTAEAKTLAMTPSKEELLTKLVYLLNSPVAGFVRVLDAIAKKTA